MLLDPGDILVELGEGRAGIEWQPPLPTPDHPDDASVLALLIDEPCGLDQLIGSSALSTDRVTGALRRLEEHGRIERRRGRWWPR